MILTASEGRLSHVFSSGIKRITFLLPIFLLASSPIFSQGNDARCDLSLSLIEQYSPDEYVMVRAYLDEPVDDFPFKYPKMDVMKFINGKNDYDVFLALNTIVHELCHGYTGLFGFRYSYEKTREGDREFLNGNVSCSSYFISPAENCTCPLS